MSHWMTSGRNRLKAKENSSFSNRAVARAAFNGFTVKKRGRNDVKNIQHNHPRFHKRTAVQDLGSSRSCPIARRGIVAAAPRRTVDSEGNDAFGATAPGQPMLRQHRRIRDPKASRYRLPSHTPAQRQPSYAYQHHQQQQPQRRVPAPQQYQQQQFDHRQQQTPQHHSIYPSQIPRQESYFHSQKDHGDEERYSPATRRQPHQRAQREHQQQASYYPQYHMNDPPGPQYQDLGTSRYQDLYEEAQSFVQQEVDNNDYADASLGSTAIDLDYFSEAPGLSHDHVDYQAVHPSPYTVNSIDARRSRNEYPSFRPNDQFRKRQTDNRQEPQTVEYVDEVGDNLYLYEEGPVYDDNVFPQHSLLPAREQRGSTGRGIWPPKNESNPMGGLLANHPRGSWPDPTQEEAAPTAMSSHRGIWPPSGSQAISASVPSQETSDAFSLSDNLDMATHHGSIHQSAALIQRQKGGGIWPGPAKATEILYSERQTEYSSEEKDIPLEYVDVGTGTNHKPPPPPPPPPPPQRQRQQQQQQQQQQIKRNQHQQTQQSKRSQQQQQQQTHTSTHRLSARQYDDMDHKVKPGCIDFSKPFAGTYNDFANPNQRNSEALSPPPEAHIQVPREVHTGKSSSVDQGSTLSSIDENGSNGNDDINDYNDDNNFLGELDNSPAYAGENYHDNNPPYHQDLQHAEVPPQQKLRYFDVDVEIDYETGEPLHK